MEALSVRDRRCGRRMGTVGLAVQRGHAMNRRRGLVLCWAARCATVAGGFGEVICSVSGEKNNHGLSAFPENNGITLKPPRTTSMSRSADNSCRLAEDFASRAVMVKSFPAVIVHRVDEGMSL